MYERIRHDHVYTITPSNARHVSNVLAVIDCENLENTVIFQLSNVLV